MKKNFFKKLSFVMALAMMVSMVAPAASALGATDPSLYVAKKYLYLNEEGKISEYDFNIKNKVAGSTYAWSSDNEAAVLVDEATGVATAQAVGTAHVTVTITFKKGTPKDLTATVIVRDNIETIDVSNVPTTDLAVGKEYNFNRSFVSFNGSTAKTSSLSRWTVDKATATIAADSGIFTATEAGEYKVTVNAFQSNAQYLAWKADPVANAALVLATKTVPVKVAAAIVSTKQVNTTKFDVTFDADMSKSTVLTTAVVYQVINGKQVSTGTEKIKKISLDTTGKIATVEMYTAFNAKTEYNFVFGDLVGKFTAASTDVADIAGIVFEDFTVNVNGGSQDLLAKVNAVNKDGVVILAGSALTSYLTFTYDGALAKGYAGGTTAYIYVEGYSAVIKAKYTNYIYNDATKVYDTITFEDSATATGVKTDTSLSSSSVQYAVLASNTTPASDNKAWGAAIAVPAGDSFYIHTRYKKVNDAADAAYTYRETAGTLAFDYSSSNTDRLVISGNAMYPIATGPVTILVKNHADGKVVGTFDVVIQAAKSFAVVTQDVPSVTVGNNSVLAETKTATVTTKDSMGSAMTVTSATYAIDQRPTGTVVVDPAVALRLGTGDDLGKVFVDVTGKTVANVSATVGAYRVKVSITGLGTTKDIYVTAIVVDGTTNNTVAGWAVELSDASVDLKNNSGKNVTIDVYGYNSAGVRVAKLGATEYSVTVKRGSTDATGFTTTNIPVVSGVSGSALTFYTVDTYVVTAYVAVSGSAVSPTGRVNGAYINATTLAVVDTTTKERNIVSTVILDSAVVTVADVVKAAFDFKVNGDAITEANITGIKYSTGAAALALLDGTATAVPGSIYVSEVQYTVTNTNGTKTVYTIPVTVTVQVQ